MHVNFSVSRGGGNLFYDDALQGLSGMGKGFSAAILHHAKSMCLVLNSSVNAYRRLDPKFEAPNEIAMSDFDRSSMVRVPLGDKDSKRIEVRSIAPDCNPYLSIYTLLKIGILGFDSEGAKKFSTILDKREKLPGNIYDAIRYFKSSPMMKAVLGDEVHAKYAELKEAGANRCPKDLGKKVKSGEILYHHEVTNQFLWYNF
jgi:glutamine synthetase